ncbi:MAG TPA: hypothetical protein VIV11_33620 [Kofleriaceae bacterium]
MTRCTACTTSTMTCPRCGNSVCVDHLAIEGDNCLDCAVAYYDSLDKVNLNVWFALGALMPWTLYAAIFSALPSWDARSGGFRAITTGFPALDVIIMFAVMSVFAGKAMMGLRKWFHRKSFVTRELARAKLVRYG